MPTVQALHQSYTVGTHEKLGGAIYRQRVSKMLRYTKQLSIRGALYQHAGLTPYLSSSQLHVATGISHLLPLNLADQLLPPDSKCPSHGSLTFPFRYDPQFVPTVHAPKPGLHCGHA